MKSMGCLNVANWSKYFNDYKKHLTINQYDFYKKHTSDKTILELIGMDSKRRGSVCEKLICKIFDLNKRTSSQNDGVRKGKKIEIKTAGYWSGTNDCRWQHLEPDHDYEFVLFVLLDFHEFKIWCGKKTVLMGELREKKVVTHQAKQGWWCKKNSIISYLTEIKNIDELDKFLEN